MSLLSQRLAILKTEERRLRNEIEQQKMGTNLSIFLPCVSYIAFIKSALPSYRLSSEATRVEKKHPEVVRLLVKHQIFDSIAQYREALPSLKREMKEAEAALIR